MALPPLQNEKIRELLGGLGKATMRGVRKCHACGTFNGTRGISCKNKKCNVIFKNQEKKKSRSFDAVKLIAGSALQLFSVRLRDRGPDYRDFVELPLAAANVCSGLDSPSMLVCNAAKCYVDNCFRNCTPASPTAANGAGLQLRDVCAHMKQAICSVEKATPLTVSGTTLDSLHLPPDIHQAVLSLMTADDDGSAPLVQRVSKYTMVVRSTADAQCPTGFVHCGFYETSKGNTKSQPSDRKVLCSCKGPKLRCKSPSGKDEQKMCIHYYACLCAFAGDDELSKEFAFCLNRESAGIIGGDGWVPGPISGLLDQNENIDAIVAQMHQDMDGEVAAAVATATAELDHAKSPQCLGDELRDGSTGMVLPLSLDFRLRPSKRKRKYTATAQLLPVAPAAVAVQQPGNSSSPGAATVAKQLAIIRKAGSSAASSELSTELQPPAIAYNPANRPIPATSIDEVCVSLTFLQWLASITERINQTMHYQFSGYPDPLVFHAPQIFFDCLQQRISAGLKKKRMPNFTTSFQRSDAPPLGTFMKYTWHITTVAHVQQIFDTPEMALELTRSFVENNDGTYMLCEAPPVETIDVGIRGKKNQLRIRPHELKTFLRVGSALCPNANEALPFVIEWIPDILPQCKIGELRVKFEYGHQRNGIVEHRILTGSIEIQTIAM